MASEHLILGVIGWYPCSGYDIKAEFEQGGAGMLSGLNFGSIYPSLKKLRDEGLVETVREGAAGRPRTVHELTARGWDELAAWLEAPTDYPIPMRDELLLKMLFWGAALPEPEDRAPLVEQLGRRRERTVELLAYIADWPTNGVSTIDEYGMLVLDYLRGHLGTRKELCIPMTRRHIRDVHEPLGEVGEPRELGFHRHHGSLG